MRKALKQALEDFRAALESDHKGLAAPRPGPAVQDRPAAIAQDGPVGLAPRLEGESTDHRHSVPEPATRTPMLPGSSAAAELTEDNKPGLGLTRGLATRQNSIVLIAVVGAGMLVWADLGGWLRPEPADKNVVASYADGIVTKEDLLGSLESHTEAERRTLATPEGLRHLVQDIAIHQAAERWAKERGLDEKNNVQHAMKHVAEDINLHDIGTQVHEGQIRVDEGEIQTYYEENRERLGNRPLSEVRDAIRETLHAGKEKEYIDAYLRDLRARASVTVDYQLLAVPGPTEEEISAYYVSRQADFREPERVRVQEIRFEASSRDKDREARDKAEKGLARVQAGEDFAQVARELAGNADPARAEGGDEVVRGSRGQEFDDKVFSLREGDVSPVVKDGDVYALVKVLEKRRERIRGLDEVRGEVSRRLTDEEAITTYRENKEKTLFTIRGRRFTLGEFLEEYQHFAPDVQARYQSFEAKKALVDQLIDRLLVLDVGSSQLLDVKNKKEIEEARRHLLAQYLHEEEMQDKLEVSDDEVKQYYQQHRTHYVEPPKVKISYVRVGMGGTEDSRKRAKERIEEAAKRLQAAKERPEAFGEVAKEFSEDPKSAANGGDLDSWLVRNNDDLSHALAHDFTETVFRLKVGETSRVINLVFFSVDETQFAVLTQFGEPIRAITQPGLQWKWPEPIQSAVFYDKRVMVLNADKAEYLTSDKKNIVVENYVAWRVADPVQYLKSLQERSRAETRLSDIVSSELGTALGKQELASLVTTEQGALKLPTVLEGVTLNSGAQAEKYGIQVVDVRAKLLNFPEKNRLSVFSRMKSERESIARKYRSEGSEEAAKIRADAERQQRVIISEAYAKAEQLRGEGDAEAIRVYAEAYGKDPEFYKFLRTLESYGKFIDDKTTVVLPSNSELLKYLNEVQNRPQGQTANQPRSAQSDIPSAGLIGAVDGLGSTQDRR